MSVYIIAEAGVNHNGDIDIAKRLVDVAEAAGANAVKFQTFVAENVVSRYAPKAEYQTRKTSSEENQLEMLRKLELSFDEFAELSRYCARKNIEFLSTAFDLDSIDFLDSLKIKRWKIPSGEITNLPYLIKIAQLGKPIILSSGMSTLDDVRAGISVLQEYGSGEITVLHCTAEYPAPYGDVNLRAMNTMQTDLNVPIGYSDHTRGIEIAIAAVALGATIIEKHFTLDRSMEGPDHRASLEPDELGTMIRAIRNVESAMGSGKKEPAQSERKNIAVVRKSIVAKTRITKGERFTAHNLTVKRPGSGISPMKWFEVIGRVAPRDFEQDELIEA